MKIKRYALLTSAKNEEKYIGQAIESVIVQTILPTVWLIVDDGSIDRTAEIVAEYAGRHPFIRLHSCGREPGRSFASQYKAIQAAYGMIKDLPFEYVGVHDADIAVQGADYYKKVLREFEQTDELGIAGGMIYEEQGAEFRYRKGNALHSVAGGIQMFRRACFDEIGGYTPLPYGGSDWLAQIKARMRGWEVRAVRELRAFHYRPTATAGGRIRGQFRLGMLDSSFGSHPIFEFVKCLRRISSKPAMVGSVVQFCGYAWRSVTNAKPIIPQETVSFLRSEQRMRIKSLIGLARD
jgi:glycosyltransferase involved in cell wall biosynthesis